MAKASVGWTCGNSNNQTDSQFRMIPFASGMIYKNCIHLDEMIDYPSRDEVAVHHTRYVLLSSPKLLKYSTSEVKRMGREEVKEPPTRGGRGCPSC